LPKPEQRTQDALNESRILVLSIQVLLSFQYSCALEPTFTKLPVICQRLELLALVLLLTAFGFLVSPVPYHLIVWHGNDSGDLQRFIVVVVELGLMPFAMALAIDIDIAVTRPLGPLIGMIMALTVFALAIFFWYGLEAMRRGLHEPGTSDHADGEEESMASISRETTIEEKIQHALIEARVVLPGAQALLGFQFVGVLLGGFESLPGSSQYMHVASLTLVTVSTILLMMPAAYHRIVEQGEATEHFFRVASNAVLCSMVPLSLGICGDFFIVARKMTGSALLSTVATAALTALFYGFWFGFSLVRRRQLKATRQLSAHT
jgi:hypothetical protein